MRTAEVAPAPSCPGRVLSWVRCWCPAQGELGCAAMDLLGELRTRPAPRPDALALAVARRLDRPLAMLGIGLAYFVVVANDALLLGGYGLYRLGGYLYGWPLPHWYLVGSAIALIPVLWLAFW